MNDKDVLDLVKENQNQRGIDHWIENDRYGTGLDSYGIGLTVLRKLAKQVGRDRALAQKLWKSRIYDLKIISMLIDDPKQMTLEQAEQQVDQLQGGLFTHVFASCSSTLAKTSFAFELACLWVDRTDNTRKTCGYNLVYELSKKKKVNGMDDSWLADRIAIILDTIDEEKTPIRAAMGGALIGIGKRSKQLNGLAIKAAKKIGPIDCYDDPEKNCDPLDVLKHLTSDYITEKLYGKSK